MAPAFEARPHLYYIIESHRFHTYPLFSIIHTAAMCTHPVQPICTFSCTSVFYSYLLIHSILYCTFYLIAHLTHFILLFVPFSFSLYYNIISCYVSLFYCFLFFIFFFLFFCTFHWADLSWLTFHYWLYPVWLCMWQIIKNLEPWVDRLKSQQCFSPLSSRWRTTSADRWGIKWLISWLEKHYIWCSYFQEVRPRRPCASESGSSLGWRHVTLAFRNPHDAAKSSQTKQTRRDLPLLNSHTWKPFETPGLETSQIL